MVDQKLLHFTLFIIFIASSGSSAWRDIQRRQLQTSSSNTTCIIDFSYVKNFSTTLDLCRGTRSQTNDASVCCPALRNTFAIGLADYLKKTGGFELPDILTVNSCLASYQASLDANRATKNFLETCFPVPYESPAMFVQEPICAGIVNLSDWRRVLRPDHPLETSCRGDLSADASCQACVDDLTNAVIQLQSLSNDTHDQQCVYISCLYAAGIVNRFGPENRATAACLLGLTPEPAPRRTKNSHAGVLAGVAAGVAALLLVGVLVFELRRRRRTRRDSEHGAQQQQLLLSKMPNLGLIKFSYQDLKAATQSFSENNFIGEGGYGRVYRGVLGKLGNSEVAVKVMKDNTTDDSSSSNSEFLNEVEVINRVRHRNLVHIRGACVHAQGAPETHQHILVYDYMPNGSLHEYLAGNSKAHLSWPERRKIAIGMATGINYLHNEVQPAIIHRDIKPSNILLDEDLNARVADFGLAKISSEGMTHLTTRVAGTPVYMAVEYALYGQCSEKVDVYSFGIVLLELMSGRKALDTAQENPVHFHIVDWAWSLVKAGQLEEIIDPSIRSSGPLSVMRRFVLVGILCAHLLVGFRPSMSSALKMLEGDEEIPPIPDRPAPYISTSSESLHSLSDVQVESSELLR